MKKVFILICFVVCLMGSVFAAEMNSSDAAWLQEFCSSYENGNLVSAAFMDRVVANCALFDAFIVAKDKGSQFILIEFFQNDYTFLNPIISGENGAPNWSNLFNGNTYIGTTLRNFGGFDGRGLIYGKSSISSASIYNGCVLTGYNSGSNTTVYEMTYRPNSTSYQSGWGQYYTYPNGQIGTRFTKGAYQNTTFYTNSDNAYIVANYSNSASYFYKLEKNVESQSYTDDSRLKIYETESITGKIVNFNLSEFLSSSSHSNTSISDDLVVTVNYDGTDQTFTFNSENANILSSSDTYIVQVPLSTFGIDDYDDVMILQVYFTDTLYTQSSEPVTTDHYISTSYYLKHDTEEIIVPSISPPATIYDDVKTQEQIDDIVNQLNEQGSQYDYTSGKFSFVSDVPDFPDWAEIYEFNVIFSRSGSDLSLFDKWHRMNGNSYSLIDWVTSTFNAVDFYEDNKAWSHADVVIITVYSVIVTLDPNNPNNFLTTNYEFEGFLVWKSDRYYDHQNSYTLIDILDGLQRIGNQQIENWTWLSDNLYNLEVLIIDGLNDIIRIDRDNLSWLKTIDVNLNNGVDSIVAAIDNISFPAVSGGFSLADLSDELQSLFIPTKTWADLGYDDYKDSLGVLALPFEFTFDSLDIIKDSSNYSPNFELHVNPLSVDIPDIDGSTKNFEVFVESDISMSPTSVFPSSVWNTLQYFNLFTLVVVQALITYNHIFGGEER